MNQATTQHQHEMHCALGHYYEIASKKAKLENRKPNLMRKTFIQITNKIPFKIVFRIEKKRTNTPYNDDDSHLFI